MLAEGSCGGSAPAPPASSKEQNKQNPDAKITWILFIGVKNVLFISGFCLLFFAMNKTSQTLVSSRFGEVLSFVHALRVITSIFLCFLGHIKSRLFSGGMFTGQINFKDLILVVRLDFQFSIQESFDREGIPRVGVR